MSSRNTRVMLSRVHANTGSCLPSYAEFSCRLREWGECSARLRHPVQEAGAQINCCQAAKVSKILLPDALHISRAAVLGKKSFFWD